MRANSCSDGKRKAARMLVEMTRKRVKNRSTNRKLEGTS